eukprot:1474907-Rhodomonas_salina.1
MMPGSESKLASRTEVRKLHVRFSATSPESGRPSQAGPRLWPPPTVSVTSESRVVESLAGSISQT